MHPTPCSTQHRSIHSYFRPTMRLMHLPKMKKAARNAQPLSFCFFTGFSDSHRPNPNPNPSPDHVRVRDGDGGSHRFHRFHRVHPDHPDADHP